MMVKFTDQEKMNVALFVKESNEIEGIFNVTEDEIVSTIHFINNKNPTIDDLIALVKVYQPDAELRNKKGLDVCVGNYIAPAGGPIIETALKALLSELQMRHPFDFHNCYEDLHPFTNGNGRTGRALWANQIHTLTDIYPIGFLHLWYYQSLEKTPTWMGRLMK